MELALLAVASYLYGAIPFAYLAIRASTGKSILDEGTGNVGVINSYRVGGVTAVVATLLGEFSKALVALTLAELIFPHELPPKLVLAFAAFLGTNFSVYLRGRGGRGTTLFMVGAALLSPLSFLLMLILCGVFFGLSRRAVWLKSLWFWFISPVFLLVERDWALAIFGLLVTLVIFLHGLRSEDDLVHHGYVTRK
ncbi:MAG TPA: glycerol-3-phosphate acyltransferase [Anaerolineae bacterium]|nr:glycerol-3-phosphate acyltransferase [Anaerolineae bacterium]